MTQAAIIESGHAAKPRTACAGPEDAAARAVYNASVIAEPMLQAAQRYTGCRIPVLPIKIGTKLPDAGALAASGDLDLLRRPSWLALSKRLATDREMKIWFVERSCGLGLVTGYRGLLVLDFDSNAEFDEWSALNEQSAGAAPLQKTARGYHVLFRWDGVWRIHLFTHNGFRLLGDGHARRIGELKGVRDYVVAWPSIHPSGATYEWLSGRSPWDVEPPVISKLSDIGIAPVSTLLQGYASSLARLIADPRRRAPAIMLHIQIRLRYITGTFFGKKS